MHEQSRAGSCTRRRLHVDPAAASASAQQLTGECASSDAGAKRVGKVICANACRGDGARTLSVAARVQGTPPATRMHAARSPYATKMATAVATTKIQVTSAQGGTKGCSVVQQFGPAKRPTTATVTRPSAGAGARRRAVQGS